MKVNSCKWTWYIDTLSWDIFKTTKYLPLNLKHGLNLCWVFIFTKVYQTRDKPKILRMNIDSTFSAWNVKCIYVMNCSAMLWILKRKRKKCFDSVSAAFFAAAAFFSFLLIVFCSLPPADSNLQRENCKSKLALTASLRSLLPGKLSLWMGDPWAGGPIIRVAQQFHCNSICLFEPNSTINHSANMKPAFPQEGIIKSSISL